MITLTNRTNRVMTINLSHEIVCQGYGACRCTATLHKTLELDPKSGETGVRETERMLCPSLHLMPGETSAPLHDAVAGLECVKQSLLAKPPRIRVDEVAVAAPMVDEPKSKSKK